MNKKNCWESKNCGRQPGGDKTGELGVCPVTKTLAAHGLNSGINGGRACWAIEGSLCGGEVQGTYAQKMGDCMKCDFYNQVRQEEGPDYKGSKEIIKLMNGEHKTSQHKSLITESPIRTNSSLDKVTEK